MIEPRKGFARSLRGPLKEMGFVIECVHAAGAELGVTHAPYDLILLGVSETDSESPSLLETWRHRGVETPVVVLLDDRHRAAAVRFLQAGADDVVRLPCPADELTARLRAVMRRLHKTYSSVVRVADLEIDSVTRTVKRNGRSIRLTPRE